MKYLITGITGTLGTAVARRLDDGENEVIGFSRDECKQAAFPPLCRRTLYLGDIRDRDRVLEASRGVDVIFHFAALKHVDKLEENPEEAIQTNILGTMNILHAQRTNEIHKVVLASTDKSAYPINVYGMSKGIAERLVLRNPHNAVCRYGNVLASRGSVVAKIVESLKTEAKAYLTDVNMSRFWITIDEAAAFVLNARFVTGLKTPVMKAASLSRLTESIARCLGIQSYEIITTGLRAGEKMAECLRTHEESDATFSYNCQQYTDEELDKMLLPITRELA